jgi:hypothetical protein
MQIDDMGTFRMSTYTKLFAIGHSPVWQYTELEAFYIIFTFSEGKFPLGSNNG